uniref:mitochondrial import inner membrane translocase subunit TIM17-2-like n=1 Tax=Erigeron canadensis TaxID=72917 RepID=UPI001CB9CF0B|nr:mitochondrial import inner membrane translocase subunit TIM17-2-like [Erigeron canadensis]
MSTLPESKREPCPDRILGDVGSAFSMGVAGGSAWHFGKGVWQSPWGHRFKGGLDGMRMNAPRTGGAFAVWGGLFSVCDCSMVYLRQKEDPWNSILSGAVTGGILSLRQGLPLVARSAAMGGFFLAMIEGAGIMINKSVSHAQQVATSQAMLEQEKQPQPLPSDSGPGWLFGGKKEQVKEKVTTEVLDSPIPPAFEYN